VRSGIGIGTTVALAIAIGVLVASQGSGWNGLANAWVDAGDTTNFPDFDIDRASRGSPPDVGADER